jgi:hypothetical protein
MPDGHTTSAHTTLYYARTGCPCRYHWPEAIGSEALVYETPEAGISTEGSKTHRAGSNGTAVM